MERAESNTPNRRTKLRRRPVLQARRKNQVVAAARLRWLWGRRDGRDDLLGRRRGGGNRIGKDGAGGALALVGGRNGLCGRLLRRHELREGAQKLACHGHSCTATEARRSGRRIPARRCRARRRGGRGAKEGVHEGRGMMMMMVVVRIRLLLLLLLLKRPRGLQQQRVLRQQLRRVGRHGNRREQARRGGRRRKPRRGVLVPAGR
jgi:hypothetical protein